MALQTAMHRGLERGEFEVHYQPLVSLVERRVTGAEALLRWRHPERGLLPPSEYIALAESNGLIVPIGEHVLRTACAQLMAWQEDTSAEHPQSMSINLSARQFMQTDLADMVSRAITDSGVAPASISFEITETSAMDDVGATVAAMEELKAIGVGLVIDDFGTGYSSLTYLKRFPVDGLKVDRSFVAGLGTDDDDSAIVTAVIDLAHSLGMVAVAEGVENAEQLERLRELGCDTAQGYHLGRPQPASAF
jgi:EAL domain-containing protein (putative c-di-GMP-specific phosphodiesterase class I)